MSKKRISNKIRKKVCDLYLDKIPVKEISIKCNVSVASLRNFLKENNINSHRKYINQYNNETKYCKFCGVELNGENSYLIRTQKSDYRCKECLKISSMESRYGVDRETYISMMKNADNKCEICGGDIKLCVDHNHETGKARGIICGNCNVMLGLASDDIELLEEAIEYLKRTNQPSQ